MRRISSRLGVLVATLVVAASQPAASGAAAGSSSLALRGTTYCIAVNGITQASTHVDLAPCNGSLSQQFFVRKGSLIYAKSVDFAIPLCIGNWRAKGRAELLGCRSHNAQVRTVSLRGGAMGFSLTGGFLSGPALGQLQIRNSTHANGREAFVQRG